MRSYWPLRSRSVYNIHISEGAMLKVHSASTRH